jgi:ATP synthase I subunit
MSSAKLPAATLALSTGILLVLLPISLVLWGGAMALGVLIGGVLMLANFQILRWSVESLLSETRRRGAAWFLVLFVLKFSILAVAFYVAARSGKVHLLGLFLGSSVVVLAVMVLAPVLGVTGLSEGGRGGGQH